MQRIKEEKRKRDEKRHPHRHLDDREGVGMTITGTEVSVRTDSNSERVASSLATAAAIDDILHLLDDILVSDVEHNSGGIERAETEDDCGYGGS